MFLPESQFRMSLSSRDLSNLRLSFRRPSQYSHQLLFRNLFKFHAAHTCQLQEPVRLGSYTCGLQEVADFRPVCALPIGGAESALFPIIGWFRNGDIQLVAFSIVGLCKPRPSLGPPSQRALESGQEA